MINKAKMAKQMMKKFKSNSPFKKSEEAMKAEADASKLDPLNEINPMNDVSIDLVDWGSCSYAKPCFRKIPGCGCLAYLAIMVTFVGGLITSIIIF